MNKVKVLHVDEVGLSESDGGKWVLFCEHGNHLIQHTNKKQLQRFVKDIELDCKAQCKQDEDGFWWA